MNAARIACTGLLLAAQCSCSSDKPGSGAPASAAAPAPRPSITAAPSATASAAPVVIPELVPGVSLGPLRLGMSRADLPTTATRHDGPFIHDVTIPPYAVRFDSGQAGSLFVELRGLDTGLRLGGATFDASATLPAIAAKLQSCTPVQRVDNADFVSCEAGRVLLTSGSPPGPVSIELLSPERAVRLPPMAPDDTTDPADPKFESAWTHPDMALSFRYSNKLFQVTRKADGALLMGPLLGACHADSTDRNARPVALAIAIAVRKEPVLAVIAENPVLSFTTLFPDGTDDSFAEHWDASERVTVAGNKGYRLQLKPNGAREDITYAALPSGGTLQIVCTQLAGELKPGIAMDVQDSACERVLETLTFKP